MVETFSEHQGKKSLEKMETKEGLYNPYVKELVEAHKMAKKLCQEYNKMRYDDFKGRKKHMREIIKTVGKNFLIEPDFWCDYGYNITLGENFYSNHNLVILDCAPVIFGDNVMVGPNCSFYAVNHPLSASERNTGMEYALSIEVGDNVWIGGNVVVLPGVKIGKNTTIGAGSVVTKDIPENVLAVGNPCRVVRELKP